MKFLKSCAIVLIICTTFLAGCSSIQSLNLKNKKPSKFYYTEEMLNCFKDKKCEINILSTKFYKGQRMDEGATLTLRKFFKYVKSENFIDPPSDLKKEPEYKLFLTFNKEKYIIDIYNEDLISIYPWDGAYEKDYISMKNTYVSYNLYHLCKYIIDNSKA